MDVDTYVDHTVASAGANQLIHVANVNTKHPSRCHGDLLAAIGLWRKLLAGIAKW